MERWIETNLENVIKLLFDLDAILMPGMLSLQRLCYFKQKPSNGLTYKQQLGSPKSK